MLQQSIYEAPILDFHLLKCSLVLLFCYHKHHVCGVSLSRNIQAQHIIWWDFKLFDYSLKFAKSLDESFHIVHKILDLQDWLINVFNPSTTIRLMIWVARCSNIDKFIIMIYIIFHFSLPVQPLYYNVIGIGIINCDAKEFLHPSLLHIVIQFFLNRWTLLLFNLIEPSNSFVQILLIANEVGCHTHIVQVLNRRPCLICKWHSLANATIYLLYLGLFLGMYLYTVLHYHVSHEIMGNQS